MPARWRTFEPDPGAPRVIPGPGNALHEHLAAHVGRQIGLNFAASRRGAVGARIRRLMSQNGIGDTALLLERIGRERDLADRLVAEVTVGDSYFFRHHAQFDFIRDRVLPGLRARRPWDDPIRVWSAGCASGEEAYSLAILLEQEGMTDHSRITASDICQEALRRARRAEFGAWSLRNGREQTLRPYFDRRGERYRLKTRLMRRVDFQHHNLQADHSRSCLGEHRGFDLILCRNVLIYMDGPDVARVARRLFDHLAPGGWLLAGPSDPPLWDHAPFRTAITPAGVVYRRPPASPTPIAGSIGAGMERQAPARRHSVMVPPAARARIGAAGELESRVHEIRRQLRCGKSRRAASMAAAAARQHPLVAAFHFLQGVALKSLDRDRAAAAFRRAIYCDMSLAAAHLELGLCLGGVDAPAAMRCHLNAIALCRTRPPGEPVRLMDGERAGSLLERARGQVSALGNSLQGHRR